MELYISFMSSRLFRVSIFLRMISAPVSSLPPYSSQFSSWQCNLSHTLCTILLAVKLETTRKPAKPSTNHPNDPQTSKTTQTPAKYRTNPPLISEKISSFFPWRHLLWQQHFPCPSCPRREMGAFFWCSS